MAPQANKPAATARTDRIPPYSEEAERGVLGSALLDAGRVIDLAVERGQLLRFTHQRRSRAAASERARVRLVVALQGEHANRERMRVFGAFLRRSVGCGCHRIPYLYDTGKPHSEPLAARGRRSSRARAAQDGPERDVKRHRWQMGERPTV